MKRTLFLIAGIILLLAACGGDDKTGVELEVAGQSSTPTATPTSEPTPPPEPLPALSGRLLLLKGQQFELLDLATGETTAFEVLNQGDVIHSFSPVILNASQTRGTFFAFPNFGVLDLVTNQVKEVRNTGSNINGMQISPDGQWMAAIGGSFRTQLRLVNLEGDGLDTQVVATSSENGFAWGWTADSRLVWWETVEPPTPVLFDPAAGESAPVGDAPLEVSTGNPVQVSPDGTRQANVPIMPAGDNDVDCFDSFVELFNLPFSTQNSAPEGETVWTESGLVASSPQWLSNDRLLFVRLGIGSCGTVQGEAAREVMLLDLSAATPEPRRVIGPLGNADDPNDRTQAFGRQYAHLFSPSPDGQYIAWISGGREARETAIHITHIETGETQVVFRTTAQQAQDLGDYIENYMLRQVVWLK